MVKKHPDKREFILLFQKLRVAREIFSAELDLDQAKNCSTPGKSKTKFNSLNLNSFLTKKDGPPNIELPLEKIGLEQVMVVVNSEPLPG